MHSSHITPLPYPLKLKALGPARYFQVREQWRLIDLFFNPMVRTEREYSVCTLQLGAPNSNDLIIFSGSYDGITPGLYNALTAYNERS